MQKILQIGCAKGIADTYGGELISYTNEGKEYIWTGDPAFWNGHAPVLFPFVSALKDWKVKFGGKEYSLTTKHGFARKSEFELVECTKSLLLSLLLKKPKNNTPLISVYSSPTRSPSRDIPPLIPFVTPVRSPCCSASADMPDIA